MKGRPRPGRSWEEWEQIWVYNPGHKFPALHISVHSSGEIISLTNQITVSLYKCQVSELDSWQLAAVLSNKLRGYITYISPVNNILQSSITTHQSHT